MLSRNRILGLGVAALLGIGILAMPASANAQFWHRHRTNPTRSEDSARNNALALAGAGLILMNSHESTLGTIALAGAALEAADMQRDIDNRHDRYGYYRGDRYGYYGGDRYGYYGGDRDDYRYRGDRDRDDYRRRGDRDRDDRRRDRDDRRDHDRDRNRGRGW